MRKIVYFDENSATDYLTILNGGTLLISDSEEEKIGDKAEIKAGAKLKVLFNSLFVSGSANLDSNIGAYTSGERKRMNRCLFTILSWRELNRWRNLYYIMGLVESL